MIGSAINKIFTDVDMRTQLIRTLILMFTMAPVLYGMIINVNFWRTLRSTPAAPSDPLLLARLDTLAQTLRRTRPADDPQVIEFRGAGRHWHARLEDGQLTLADRQGLAVDVLAPWAISLEPQGQLRGHLRFRMITPQRTLKMVLMQPADAERLLAWQQAQPALTGALWVPNAA